MVDLCLTCPMGCVGSRCCIVLPAMAILTNCSSAHCSSGNWDLWYELGGRANGYCCIRVGLGASAIKSQGRYLQNLAERMIPSFHRG
jgi:hypothetical protein